MNVGSKDTVMFYTSLNWFLIARQSDRFTIDVHNIYYNTIIK